MKCVCRGTSRTTGRSGSGVLAVQRQADGTTVLVGPVVDQAALHGVISRIRDLGVPLLSVRRPAHDINEGVDDERE